MFCWYQKTLIGLPMSLDAAPVYIAIKDMFYLKHSTLLVFPELYRR